MRILWAGVVVLALAGCKKEQSAPPAAATQSAPTSAADAIDRAAKEPNAQKISATSRDGTQSQLVLQVLQPGTGDSPKASNKVRVNYRGTLLDGTEFDASAKHGGPIEFPLNGVIPCWTEGVQHMKVGEKAKLTCPPELAYGSRGAGGVIPPNATLVFEIDLLGITG